MIEKDLSSKIWLTSLQPHFHIFRNVYYVYLPYNAFSQRRSSICQQWASKRMITRIFIWIWSFMRARKESSNAEQHNILIYSMCLNAFDTHTSKQRLALFIKNNDHITNIEYILSWYCPYLRLSLLRNGVRLFLVSSVHIVWVKYLKASEA